GGNTINNFAGRSLYMRDGQQLDGLKRWYFYRGHIVGELEQGQGWFVVNEGTSEMIWQTDREKWQAIVEARGLVPGIWTRWWDSDPAMLTNGLFLFLLVTAWFVAIPILLLVLLVLTRAWRRERFNWRKPYTLCAMAIGLLVLSRIVLE